MTQIKYRYIRIELEQFAIFDENCTPANDNAQFQTAAQFSYDTEQHIICSSVSVTLSNNDDAPMLRAELRSYFDIRPESVETLRHNGVIEFDVPLLIQFASLCYGSLRGVIFTKTNNTPLNGFVLPPVYFSSIIDKPFIVKA